MNYIRFRFVTLLCILLHSLSSFAYDAQIDGIYYNLNNRDYTAEVTAKPDGTKYIGNIIIPEEIDYNSNTYTVKSLGNAFNGCDGLLSLQLPNTIVNIGSLSGCSNLKEIVVPDLVTQIEETAFKGCSNLESISLGSNINKIGRNAFTNCDKLKSVYIL